VIEEKRDPDRKIVPKKAFANAWKSFAMQSEVKKRNNKRKDGALEKLAESGVG